jgi:hypothetical protein
MQDLKMYDVYVKLTVLGEHEDDVLDTAFTATNLLIREDGIVAVEILDDSVELRDPDFDEDDDK